MYPLYFYLCLFSSLGLILGLVLLAVYPVRLPLVPADEERLSIPRKISRRRPVHRSPPTTQSWDDDEDNL